MCGGSETLPCSRPPESNIAELEIEKAFNYGVACFGLDGAIDQAVFERVVEIDKSGKEKTEDSNHMQCMAIFNARLMTMMRAIRSNPGIF